VVKEPGGHFVSFARCRDTEEAAMSLLRQGEATSLALVETNERLLFYNLLGK
jgi:hypothetical protein